MSKFGYSTAKDAEAFAEARGIDIDIDHRAINAETCLALPTQTDESGHNFGEMVYEAGADYAFYQLDYLTSDRELRATRMIARIHANKRTELAYWTQAAPTKLLTVHKGVGRLVIGRPSTDSTDVFRLDAEITPAVRLPSGVFYTFEGGDYPSDPLVVSGLYRTEQVVDWDATEIALQSGQREVEAPEGVVVAPEEFLQHY